MTTEPQRRGVGLLGEPAPSIGALSISTSVLETIERHVAPLELHVLSRA